MTMVVSLVAVLLGAGGLAQADNCSCTYEGTRSCSARTECPDLQVANCSCTKKGCTASCSAAGPNQITCTFSLVETNDALLDGIANHLEKVTDWTLVTRTPLGAPLTLERRTEIYAHMTYEELLQAIADDYGLCAEIHEKKRIVVFKPRGTCR
jgi:hypothetical protein